MPDLAKVIAQSLPDSQDPAVLEQFCDSFRDVAGARITLMDRDGKVLGESDADTAEVGTKLDRPECKRPSQGSGKQHPFQQDLRIDMLYTAVFLERQGQNHSPCHAMTK